MAEGRMLKRKITKSKKFADLRTDKARLLWFYMLPFTDVEGRLEADAEDIRDEIIRKQRKGFTIDRVEECLQDLHQVGLIILYNNESKRFLEYTRFSDEQNLRRDKEAESRIPAPQQEQYSTNPAAPTLSKEKLSKEKLSKEKEKFLDFVFLTREEHQKLVTKFGVKGTKERIGALNEGIGSKGYRYKSHYFTILSWDRKNKAKDTNQTPDLKICIVDRKPGYKYQNNRDGTKIWLCKECFCALDSHNWGNLSLTQIEKIVLQGKTKR